VETRVAGAAPPIAGVGLVSAAPAEAAPADGLGLSRPFEIYALVLILLVQTLAYLDRQVIHILAEPIKHEFGLRDWQLGALTGTAFALFYATLGLPIARLGERVNRPRLIGAAVSLWSLFTILSGLTTNFVQLALARVGVGFGEAGSAPSCHSLLAAYVPKARRAAAFSMYAAGLPMGTLLGLVLGGVVGEAYGWRTAFLVAGAPGLAVGLLAATTLVEPRRRLAQVQAPPPFKAALRELLGKKAFVLITLGATIGAFVGNARNAFNGSFFLRTHHDGLAALAGLANHATGLNLGPVGFLGLALGLSGGLFGVLGTLLGGWLTDRAARRHGVSAYMAMLAVTAAVSIPLSALALIVSSTGVALVLLALAGFAAALGQGGLYASIQSLARPSMRTTASALFLFLINIVALTLGPLTVGALSDLLSASGFGEVEGLRWALVIAQVSLLSTVVIFWAARRPFALEVVD
jgi:MFS family permease